MAAIALYLLADSARLAPVEEPDQTVLCLAGRRGREERSAPGRHHWCLVTGARDGSVRQGPSGDVKPGCDGPGDDSPQGRQLALGLWQKVF